MPSQSPVLVNTDSQAFEEAHAVVGRKCICLGCLQGLFEVVLLLSNQAAVAQHLGQPQDRAAAAAARIRQCLWAAAAVAMPAGGGRA